MDDACLLCRGPTPSRLTGCGHRLHSECAAEWLLLRRHPACPFCNERIDTRDLTLLLHLYGNRFRERDYLYLKEHVCGIRFREMGPEDYLGSRLAP